MNDMSVSPQVYHHHWLAFWKPLAGISFLLVLSIGGALVSLPLGLSLVILALIGAVSVYLAWSWHTFTFTAGNRLVRRRGFLGCTKDAITLFGVVTPYQIPVLGQWLDMGNVYLGLPGPDIHIRYIAHFTAFYRRLIHGAQQQGSHSDSPPVQVIVQLPPSPRAAGG
jgi:hypothetical protein